tara:strand:- start:54 stop:1964 length:1911 start_codon:yes stop_codon:yes gene_type:complete
MEEEEKKNLWDARSGLRTGLGLGFEVGANTLLDVFSFEPTSQVAGGTFINYLAQKIRGGEISKGELAAAGLTSLIPGGAQARAITRGGRFTTSVAKGALSGGITSTSMSLLDEGRLPTAGEFAGGVGLGGAFGGIFDLAPAAVTGKLGSEVSEIAGDTGFFLRQLKRRLQGGDLIFNPATYYGPGFGAGTIGAARNPMRPDDPDFKQLNLNLEAEDLLDATPRADLPAGLSSKFKTATSKANLPGYVEDVGDSLVFKYKPFREATRTDKKTGKLGGEGRYFLELFQTPMSEQYPQLTTGDRKVYEAFKKSYRGKMRAAYDPVMDAMGLNLKKPFNFEIHHIAALKTVMGIYDGVGFESQLHRAINKRLLQKLNGIGNMKENLLGVMGSAKEKDTPHYLAHIFLQARTGKKMAGEEFFTDTVLDKMAKSDKFRLDKADELGDILLESELIARQAQEVIDTMYAQGDAIEPDVLIDLLGRLNDRGYLKGTKIDEKFQIARLPQMIEDIIKLQDVEYSIPGIDLVKAIGKDDKLLKILRMLQRYSTSDLTPPANVMNKLLKRLRGEGQLEVFGPEEQIRSEIEKWLGTIRKRRGSLKRTLQRKNIRKYQTDEYFESIKPRSEEGIDTGKLDEFGYPIRE